MNYGRQEETFQALKGRKRDDKVLHPHNPIKEDDWIIVSSRGQAYEITANIHGRLDLIIMDVLIL
jgi:hypothetical protein